MNIKEGNDEILATIYSTAEANNIDESVVREMWLKAADKEEFYFLVNQYKAQKDIEEHGYTYGELLEQKEIAVQYIEDFFNKLSNSFYYDDEEQKELESDYQSAKIETKKLFEMIEKSKS